MIYSKKQKLSTEILRKKMSMWLTTISPDNFLYGYHPDNDSYDFCFDTDPMEERDIPPKKYLDKALSSWYNSANWKRESKSRESFTENITNKINAFHHGVFLEKNIENFIWYPYDDIGDGNIDLINAHHKDDAYCDKCWMRVFVNDDYADNFQLCVWTTPEDDEVIGWSLSVD